MWMRIANRTLAALALLFASALAVWPSALAQEHGDHRLFALRGDITIDGDPLKPGDIVTILSGEQAIAETTVDSSGAWLVELRPGSFAAAPCSLRIAINGVTAEVFWETCPRRINLDLVTVREVHADADAAADASADAAANAEADAKAEAEAGTEAEPGTDDQELNLEPASSSELDRPGVPKTGTGNLLRERPRTNWWPIGAAALACLVSGAAAVVMLRRKNMRQSV